MPEGSGSQSCGKHYRGSRIEENVFTRSSRELRCSQCSLFEMNLWINCLWGGGSSASGADTRGHSLSIWRDTRVSPRVSKQLPGALVGRW